MHRKAINWLGTAHIPWAALLLGLALGQAVAANAAPEGHMVQTLRYGDRRHCVSAGDLYAPDRWKLWLIWAPRRDCQETPVNLVAHRGAVGVWHPFQ